MSSRHFVLAGYTILHLAETGSTNDEVLTAISKGEPDGLVIVADRQTKGRGRGDRVWVTETEQSLAFTLLIRPNSTEKKTIARFTALAGVALARLLRDRYGAEAQVKWPNDVLINDKKVCGILAETLWEGDDPQGVALGIGINLGQKAVPQLVDLVYPASSIQSEIGCLPERWTFLEALLTSIRQIREQLCSDSFIREWNDLLAFRGEVRPVRNQKGEMQSLRLLYVDADASLVGEDEAGSIIRLYSGELGSLSSSSSVISD